MLVVTAVIGVMEAGLDQITAVAQTQCNHLCDISRQ